MHVLKISPEATPRPRISVINMNNTRVPRAYYPEFYVQYKAALGLLIKQLKIQPLTGPCKLEVTFYLPYPKSTPKKHLIDNYPHIRKPDVDNYLKGLLDGLEAVGIVENDSIFYDVHGIKLYTLGQPRIEFNI